MLEIPCIPNHLRNLYLVGHLVKGDRVVGSGFESHPTPERLGHLEQSSHVEAESCCEDLTLESQCPLVHQGMCRQCAQGVFQPAL